MIAITKATAFLLYLGATLALVLFLWISHERRAKKRRTPPVPYSTQSCEFCGHGYIAAADKSLTRCPSCKSLNQKARSSSQA